MGALLDNEHGSPSRLGALRLNPRAARAIKWSFAPLFILIVIVALDRAFSARRVLRGVWLGDAALSGLDRAAAERAVTALAERLETRSVRVGIGNAIFELEPKTLGYRVDVESTVAAALARGRSGGPIAQLRFWLARFGSADELVPIASLDRTALQVAVERWSREALPDPPIEGGVMAHDGRIAPRYPRRGRGIDPSMAERMLIDALGRDRVDVVMLKAVEIEPRVSRAAVDDAVVRAQRLADRKVELVDSESKARIELEPGDIATLLRARIEPNAALALEIDPDALEPRLEPMRKVISVHAQDARFAIDERERVSITPSRQGRAIDAHHVAVSLLKALDDKDRIGQLPIERGELPKFTTEDAVALHIDGLVSHFTTHHVCCQPRVNNIHRIADLLDGRTIRPGETFSVNATVGERTAANGFVIAPSIEDGEMVDAIGGGVSQFATTFFNAIFYGGYDIIERAPHSYWFTRYPMGHEATLAWPKPDLVFRNDTDAGILIKTSYTDTSITVKLFGNNGGRKVRAEVSPRFDIVRPPLEHVADPSLRPDQEKTDEAGMVGWSVNVGRVLTFADGHTKEEKRKVTYKPRVRRVRVHPCRIPEGEPGYTGERCPVPESPDGGPPEP